MIPDQLKPFHQILVNQDPVALATLAIKFPDLKILGQLDFHIFCAKCLYHIDLLNVNLSKYCSPIQKIRHPVALFDATDSKRGDLYKKDLLLKI
jgi:hypothetical protein